MGMLIIVDSLNGGNGNEHYDRFKLLISYELMAIYTISKPKLKNF